MIIKRVGGKTKIKQWVTKHLPSGNIFVDVFGGSGAILQEVIEQTLNRDIRYIYNDGDNKVYTFFKVLQNDSFTLANLVNLTPYSRYGFTTAYDAFKSNSFDELPDLEKSLIFLIINRQSFSSKMSKDWSITRKGEINYKTWNSLPEYIIKTAEYWKNTFLENLDYKDVITKWDSKKTSFYLDPPYEKVENDYYEINQKSGFDHIEMFEFLQNIQGSYCISYYGGEDCNSDSKLIKMYVNAGCKIYRKSVKKHISTEDEKPDVIEVLLVKNKTHKNLIGKTLTQFCYDDESTARI